jgi:Fur family zinc uptake transcriptional regulator
MTSNSADANTLCTDHGVRLTPQRARVLALLRAAPRPLKAYDLLPELGSPGRPAKPPTAYRALDFLVEHGLVHRIESLNAYVACDHAGADHPATFLICDRCGSVAETHVHEPVAGLSAAAARQGFRLSRVAIEAHGECRACAQTA